MMASADCCFNVNKLLSDFVAGDSLLTEFRSSSHEDFPFSMIFTEANCVVEGGGAFPLELQMSMPFLINRSTTKSDSILEVIQ